MLFVDFCKGPKGYWIGCAEFQNGRAFASGRTIDILVDHIKTMVYKTWRISARNVMLSSRQMEVGEFQAKHFAYMSARFKGKFWNPITVKPKKQQPDWTKLIPRDEAKPEVVITGKIKKDTPKFTYEEKDGVLYVYETKLVAKFEVYGGENAKQTNGD